MRKILLRLAACAAALIVAAYLAVCGYLYLNQRLMVFPGKTASPALTAELAARHPSMRRLEIAAPDGAVLAGWLIERGGPGAPLVLYFGGNLDASAEFMLGAPEALPGLSIAALDYRGYGQSTGAPSETALKADALLSYDRLRAQCGGCEVAVMGRSLGTAMAAHVAANRKVAALVMVTPFDSIQAVGQERHPLIPVGLLIDHPFDVMADAARIGAPTLILIAKNDVTVPPGHALRLVSAWRGPLQTATFTADHATILSQPGYWPRIREFLRTALD
jgi:uncharacterized protein